MRVDYRSPGERVDPERPDVDGPVREADERDEEPAFDRCPECEGRTSRPHDRTETLCEDCGLVVEERRIDHGPEWRAFDQTEREDRSRVGAPVTETMHDRGLTTSIDWQDRDANGRALSSRKRSQMRRLRRWQERIRTKDATERNLQFALSEIGRMTSALGVPYAVRQTASVIYRRALAEGLIRGRSIESVATGALYAACRQEGLPRSLEEVAAVARVEKREIGRTYRYVAGELELEMTPVDPKEFLPRFCSALGLDETVQAKAREVIDVSAERGLLSGRSPTGCAAAAIYTASLLCDDKRTQQDIADVAQVTDVTVRNRYQEQLDALGLLREAVP